jgi:hypothetical protein
MGAKPQPKEETNMRSLTITFVAVALLLLSAGDADAVKLTDYKFPISTSQEAYVNWLLNTSGQSADTTEVSYNFGGSANYRLNFRSLPLSYDFSVVGNFSLAKGSEKDSESEDAYYIMATTGADKYFREDKDYFGYGAASFEYRKLSSMEDADDPRVDLEAGAGYGRTINATVLKQAIRMNEDFLKYGVIKSDLPDEALLDLAAVIDREAEFRSKHGNIEYRKYWYEEMEKIIRDSGMLSGDSLGAIGILRIQEVLDEPTAQRWHGWVARVGVGARVSDFDGESGDPRLTARFDWTRPYGIDLQLRNNATYSTVFEDDPVHTFSDIFRVDYEVSNRIDWYNSLGLSYDMPTADGLENILRMDLTSTYFFYIENQLSFSPEFQYQFVDDGFGDSEWNWTLLMSFSYRLR